MPNRFLGTEPASPGERDATHVAMISVRAKQTLSAGERVGKDGTKNSPVGIVDPFLKRQVFAGDLFWLCLDPNSTTDMKHHWSHPEFEETGSVPKDENFYRQRLKELLSDLSEEVPTDLEGFLLYLEDFTNYGDFLHADGFDAYGSIPGEVWDCVKALTGDDHGRPSGFSCSC